jgi:uncharacterized protein (TIGR00255 family)
MTGYGHGVTTLAKHTFKVEIRTLNHRGLDVKVRTQDCLFAPETEAELLRLVRQAFARGSVLVTVRDEHGTERSSGLNLPFIKQLHADLSSLNDELGLTAPIDLVTLGTFLSVIPASACIEIQSTDWEALRPAVEMAISNVTTMRQREGALLGMDLIQKLASLRKLTHAMRETSALVPSRASQRIQERLATLGVDSPPIDPARFAQEITLLAERFDVHEELVRLAAHCEQLEFLLTKTQNDAIGRKLDFLSQEMGREINTIGSKIQDVTTIALVVEAKTELEKIREQAQNIE